MSNTCRWAAIAAAFCTIASVASQDAAEIIGLPSEAAARFADLVKEKCDGKY